MVTFGISGAGVGDSSSESEHYYFSHHVHVNSGTNWWPGYWQQQTLLVSWVGFPAPSLCQGAAVTYDRRFDLVTALWLWFGRVMKLVMACWARGGCPYRTAFFGLFSLNGVCAWCKMFKRTNNTFSPQFHSATHGQRSGAAVSVTSKRGSGRECNLCLSAWRWHAFPASAASSNSPETLGHRSSW